MTVPEASEVPFYLRGNFAPILMECEALDLPVAGELPEGAHLRPTDVPTFDGIAHLDLSTVHRDLFAVPAGDAVSEPVFVPKRPNAEEGDGWLLTVAWRG